MQIPILIEPIEGGRFRARAGEPLAISADGASKPEAIQKLREQIEARLRAGAELQTLMIGIPIAYDLPPADELYKTDWFFKELQETIAENRRREDDANP